MSTPWFDPAALIWMGPGLGLAEALWGGAAGLLAYGFATKGRGRALLQGWLLAGLIAGVGFLAAGVAGWLAGQPVPIWASLVAAGGPLLVAALFTRANLRNLYRLIELRRMHAQEM
jgi:hypothetical protein